MPVGGIPVGPAGTGAAQGAEIAAMNRAAASGVAAEDCAAASVVAHAP
jgi:hypothetical protein